MVDQDQLTEALAAVELTMRQDGYGNDEQWLKVRKAVRLLLTGTEVGERTIEWRDQYGGYSDDVLDYEVDRKRVGRYLVIRLDDDD